MAELTPEVYPSSPLRLLSGELQFSYEPEVNKRAVRDKFAEILRPFYPNFEEEDAPSSDSGADPITEIRLSDDDHQYSVALSAHGLEILLAGHAYTGVTDYAERVRQAYAAAKTAVPELRIERLGLRYVNELRFAGGVNSLGDWGMWVAPALLGPTQVLPGSAVVLMAHLHFETDEGYEMLLQYGDREGDSVVNDKVPVDLPAVDPEQSYFYIDLDGAAFPQDKAGLTEDEVLGLLHELHSPIRLAFENSITDDARAEFRKDAADVRTDA